VIAATNRPDIIDPAMLRPGRLDKLLYVPLPSKDDRHSILKTVTKKLPLKDDVQLRVISHSEHCEGFSGADLSSLVREAQLSALKQAMESNLSEDAKL
jgi:ribosome biogenesis ATPase